MPTLSDEPTAPHCIGCGATAERKSWGWETAHELDCPWMADPESEPYP
jgi:hypothetical protein